jgi:hypothetical protein
MAACTRRPAIWKLSPRLPAQLFASSPSGVLKPWWAASLSTKPAALRKYHSEEPQHGARRAHLPGERRQASPSYTYVVPLTDLKQQWQRVEGNLRRLIKRCTEVEGLHFTDDGDFDSFFRLHSLTLGRRNVSTYLPELAFRRFVERLRTAGIARLQHARLPNGAAIASQLVLFGKHPVSHTVCAGMDPEYSRLGASAFLRWRGFETLAGLGYQANDLTDAALNSVAGQAIGDALRLPRSAVSRFIRAFRRGLPS